MKSIKLISKSRIKRIREQGYFTQTDEEVSELAFGNRFAYILCSSIVAIGVLSANIPVLSAMLVIAFLGFVLPNHPFDYIYNYLLAERLNKPLLPKRSEQLKFACSVATVFLMTTIYLFYNGFTTAGYIVGMTMLSVATLVSTFDICIPSIIYNAFFLKKVKDKFKNSARQF